MAATYDEAVAELFRAPHATFVAERKRLAGELKAAGDKAGAATLGKLSRPPISAWAVNQLWWQARTEFDALLETAKKVGAGDLSATPAHREALSTLRARAAKVLTEAGNAANESTLRRVATTLSAIAASGGFSPDPAGALTEDRDPPGFEAVGIVAPPVAPPPAPALEAKPAEASADDGAARVREEELARERAQAEAERQKLELELGVAREDLQRLEAELARLKQQVTEAEGRVVKARARVAELEAQG